MLARLVTVLVASFASISYASTLEQALVGEWQSEVGSQLTFRSDHTFTSRAPGVTITGTWSVRGNRLITVNKSLSGREAYTNSCDIILQRDQFSYGMCEHVEKRSGRPATTEPELYTTGAIYHRVKHGQQASNQALERTADRR
jgi:hypothetical protein